MESVRSRRASAVTRVCRRDGENDCAIDHLAQRSWRPRQPRRDIVPSCSNRRSVPRPCAASVSGIGVLREQPKFGRKVAGQAEISMPSSDSHAADSSFGPPEMRH
jgi:hypothetical protein